MGFIGALSLLASCAPASHFEDDARTSRQREGFSPRLANPADKPGGSGVCDRHLADVFGGGDTVAAGSGFEPAGFLKSAAILSGLDRSMAVGPLPNNWGHLFGYAMHIYGTPPGSVQTALYIPSGFTKHTAPNGNDAVSLFYYPSLGIEKNVTLAVYHLADLSIQTTVRNAAGSIRIGNLGGPGGDGPDYQHSHLEVHRGWGLPPLSGRNATRLFFRDVFCPIDDPSPIPPGWVCDQAYYDEAGQGAAEPWCDCACGAPDPDCATDAPLSGCGDGQRCSTSGQCVSD